MKKHKKNSASIHTFASCNQKHWNFLRLSIAPHDDDTKDYNDYINNKDKVNLAKGEITLASTPK